MSVSSRTKVNVVAQLVQLLIPAEISLQNLLPQALQQVFFASNAAKSEHPSATIMIVSNSFLILTSAQRYHKERSNAT